MRGKNKEKRLPQYVNVDIDVKETRPDKVVETIQAALSEGMLQAAHRLAGEGHKAHPNHKGLHRFAWVLLETDTKPPGGE